MISKEEILYLEHKFRVAQDYLKHMKDFRSINLPYTADMKQYLMDVEDCGDALEDALRMIHVEREEILTHIRENKL
jgi:hypothetical protein